MRTELVQGFAALVAMIALSGCGPQLPAYSTKPPERLKQLTDVTDAVVRLASIEGAVEAAERRSAIRQTVAALRAAYDQYRGHGDALSGRGASNALACASALAIEVMDLETRLSRIEEVKAQGDEAAKRHKALLMMMSHDASRCAALGVELMVHQESRRDALQHAAIVISETYAIAAAFRAADELPLELLLKDQIAAYERIAEKLGPKHRSQVIADGLPKLKEALADLRGPKIRFEVQ